MADYRDAINALASSIEASDSDLTADQKTLLARKILKGELEIDSSGVRFEGSAGLDLSDEASEVLTSYLQEIRTAREANLGSRIEASIENARRLKLLRDELRRDISRAYDEDEELQRIAERLQDSDIGRMAGKEKHQINELGRKLELLERRGRQVEELDGRLEALLDEHGVEVDALNTVFEERESRVRRLLDVYSARPDIDSIVASFAEDEVVLERAESMNSDALRSDLEMLSDIYEYKEFEAGLLRDVEDAMSNGRFEEALNKLDEILERRDDLLEEDVSTIEDVHRDLEDTVEIASGLKKLFRNIETVETNKNIDQEVFYSELSSALDFPDSRSSQKFVGRLQKEYGGMQSLVEKAERLEEYSLERDKSNYEKIKQLDRQDSELRSEASEIGAERVLKSIHEKLQELGYHLENEISVEEGDTGSHDRAGGADRDRGSDSPGPASDGEPWIVSISDLESWPQFLTESLKMVNKKYKPIVDLSGDSPTWAGNNYKLIINGDLIQHGRNGSAAETRELIRLLRSIVSSAENQTKDGVHPVKFTVGNHDPNLLFGNSGMFPEDDEIAAAKGEGFVETYRQWTDRKIVKMAIPGHNFTYVHAGQPHEWTRDEITAANKMFRNMDRSYTGSIPFPDHEKLKHISITQTDADKLPYESLIQTVKSLGTEEMIRLLGFDRNDLYTESDSVPDYMHGVYKGDLKDTLNKRDILNSLENANQLGLNRIKFSTLKDEQNKYAKLLGVGEAGSGDNIHAGMTWARTEQVKYGPPQIVGHTGKDTPIRDGNIIVENTSAGSGNPSVVIETSTDVWGLVSDSSGTINQVNL